MTTSLTDVELLIATADGDRAAFDTLYRRHVDAVLRTASRRCTDPHDAADVVADTFVAVWRNAASFDARRGNVSQWISGIAARKFLDSRRGSQRQVRLAHRAAHSIELSTDATDELINRIDAEAARTHVFAAVERLPERQRLVFELVVMEGLSVATAAEALGMTQAAASMRLTRARRALQASTSPTVSYAPEPALRPSPRGES